MSFGLYAIGFAVMIGGLIYSAREEEDRNAGEKLIQREQERGMT